MTSHHPAELSLVWARVTSREVLTFLAVGGSAYLVDVAAFNVLFSVPALARRDPTIARVLAVAVAMVVTYLGNRFLTWRSEPAQDPVRELSLFVVVNLLGMGFSVATLFVSHDLLGLTTRLDDNVSANLIGVGLGTVFRFWAYRRFVFAAHRRDRMDLSFDLDLIDRCRVPRPARRTVMPTGARRTPADAGADLQETPWPTTSPRPL